MALFPLFSSPRGGGADGRASPSTLMTANASASGANSSGAGGGGDRCAPLGSWEFSQAFSVGRSRRCELKIPTNKDTLTVSKRHLGVVPMAESVAVTLRAAGGDWTFARRRWVLFDMEPMNGTAVNGVEMSPGGTHELRDGDLVVLASAMRQCVQLSVHFSDRAYTSIAIKAVSRTLSPSALSSTTNMRSETPVTVSSIRTRSSTSAMELCRPPIHAEETPERSNATSQDVANEPMLAAPVSSKRSRGSTPEEGTPARSSRLRRSSNAQQQTDGAAQQRKRTRRSERTREAETQETQDVVSTQTDTSTAATASSSTSEDRIAQSASATGSEQERERFMVCPVCLDYFHASATLPCSHTFCGQCISSWFRTSLSCPECRDVVRALPVRNRALDDLVQRLVGETKAYKSLTERRAQQQRESAMQRVTVQNTSSIFGALSPTRRAYHHQQSYSFSRQADVFSRWSVDEKHAFSAFIGAQFGETRIASCRKIGLTERTIDSASVTELLVAAQNLLLDCSALRGVGDEGRQRLKIFLFYG